jgi:Ca-activated chloride channel family protein
VPADARGTLRLTGRQAGGEFAREMPFDAARADFHPGITTLWARQKVAEAVDAWRRAEDEVEKKDLRQRVIDDAIAYRLVTKFTSLVAVEEKVVNPGGDARTAMVPTELPHGWDQQQWFGGMPASGTADLFLETAALVSIAGGLILAWLRTRGTGAHA